MKIIFRIILLIAMMVGLVFGYYWLMQRYSSSQNKMITGEQLQQWQLASERGEPILVKGRLTSDDNIHYFNVEEKGKIEVRSDNLSLSSFVNKEIEALGVLRGEVLVINKIQEVK